MSLQADFLKRFSDFSLEVSLRTENDILGILGASGSGKSMTLKCIAGIETPDEGRIVLNGRVLFDSSRRINLPVQKRKVGYLFQHYALFPNMTVEANIAAGLRGTREEKRAAVERMIKLFRLKGLESRYPFQLSGGQQQRTALARSLVYEPDIILLDEPFSALDSYLKEQLQFQVKEVLCSYAGDTLLVTHSRDEVFCFCEKSLILDRGKVVRRGGTEDIFKRPGNVTAARLTGCKNISRARRLDSRHILALDWGIRLETAEEVGEEIRFAGIRAHQFAPFAGGANEFLCQWIDTLRQPFEWDVLLRPLGASDKEADREPLWWRFDYSQSKVLKERQIGDIVTISVKPEDVLLLRDG